MMATTLNQVKEILNRFPIRNDLWSFTETTGTLASEISTLQGNNRMTDPWNRPLPPFQTWVAEYDPSGEDLAGHKLKTTVAGISIDLLIIAD